MAQGRSARSQAKTPASQAKVAAANGAGSLETAAEGTVEIGNVDLKKVSGGLGDTGIGFMSAAASVYFAALAYAKFRQALGKSYVVPPGQ